MPLFVHDHYYSALPIVVGSDAGLLNKPEPLTAPYQPLRMGVAERYGIIIDFSKFPDDVEHVYLRDLGFSSNLGTGAQAIVRFDLGDRVVDDCILPKKLGKVTLRAELEKRSTQTRTFQFGRGTKWMINGKTWDSKRVDANPGQCNIETWNLVNMGGRVHPVHIHLVDFQIVSRNGMAPLPYERGWKDVILLREFERVQIVARFGPHRGKYMMHCHNIVHEDHDMMNQFEIGRDGPDPVLADPAKPLPTKPLGSIAPPQLVDTQLPANCSEALPNGCTTNQ
jgi:spore coat protein A